VTDLIAAKRAEWQRLGKWERRLPRIIGPIQPWTSPYGFDSRTEVPLRERAKPFDIEEYRASLNTPIDVDAIEEDLASLDAIDFDDPAVLASLDEEAVFAYEVMRYDTTLDLYRLAIHALGGLDSVLEVPEDIPEAVIAVRRNHYLRALSFADGLHDRIEEVFRDKRQPVAVHRGKFYRLRHRLPGDTKVEMIERSDPPRVRWRGKDYWSLKLYGSFWLADGHRGKPPKPPMPLEEINFLLGDSVRLDVPSTFTPLDLKTMLPTYRGVRIQRWFHWQGRPRKKKAPSFDEVWMTSDNYKADDHELPRAQRNYTVLYAALDRLDSLQATLVWDWYFAGMTYKELRREYRIPENKLRAMIQDAVASLDPSKGGEKDGDAEAKKHGWPMYKNYNSTRQTARTPTWSGALWVRHGVETAWPVAKPETPDPRASLAWHIAPGERKKYRPLNLDVPSPKTVAAQFESAARELGAAPPRYEIEKTYQWIWLNPRYEAWRRIKLFGAYYFRVVKHLGLVVHEDTPALLRVAPGSYSQKKACCTY
jgi:hypothetical protein